MSLYSINDPKHWLDRAKEARALAEQMALKPADDPGRHRLESQPSSRTGENPPYGMIGRIEETSASFEARYAPRSYPTSITGRHHEDDLISASRRRRVSAVPFASPFSKSWSASPIVLVTWATHRTRTLLVAAKAYR